MRMPLTSSFGVALFVGSCSSSATEPLGPARSETASRSRLSFEGQPVFPSEIALSLSRTECYGSCPIYTITLHGDGRVDWEGTKFVASIGERHLQVEPQVVSILLRRAEELHVFDLPNEYSESVADIPDTVHGFRIAGRVKSIRVHSLGNHRWADGSEVPGWQSSHGLMMMADAFDALVDSPQWIYSDAPQPVRPRFVDHDLRKEFRLELICEPTGRSPEFSLSIEGDGRLHWHGEKYVQVVGDREVRIDPQDVELLASRLEASKCLDEPIPAAASDDSLPIRLRIQMHDRQIARAGRIGWTRDGDRSVCNSVGYFGVLTLVEAIARADQFIGTNDDRGADPWFLEEEPK